MTLTAVDLFAGCGGTCEGAVQAGLRVLVAANHWPVAVATHRLNHPEVEHLTQDLQQADFHTWPDFDVLLASPACQGHTRARGKERPHHDASRSAAWAVVACAEAKKPQFLAIENVPEFRRWSLYPEWTRCLRKLGYTLTENVLDAADFGVPQHRRRLFVVGVHKAVGVRPLVIPPGESPHVPAVTVLDPNASNWSPILKRGRALDTVRRIIRGRRVYGDRFLVAYFGKEKGGRNIHQPLGTVLTRDRYALIDGPWMRMLTATEYRRAMGFGDNYRLPDTHRLAVSLLGNAVCPPVAKHVCESIKAYAGGHFASRVN
jgi:DNA (cytosine-5)-methyltransferase 1